MQYAPGICAPAHECSTCAIGVNEHQTMYTVHICHNKSKEKQQEMSALRANKYYSVNYLNVR